MFQRIRDLGHKTQNKEQQDRFQSKENTRQVLRLNNKTAPQNRRCC